MQFLSYTVIVPDESIFEETIDLFSERYQCEFVGIKQMQMRILAFQLQDYLC